MSEKTMAELMRMRTKKALADNTDITAEALFREVLELIEDAAADGKNYLSWKAFVRYYDAGGYRIAALRKVEDMLEAEGFRVYSRGCAVHGLGIGW